MAHIVVLGAGLGGTLMAYELVPVLGASDTLSVIGQGSQFHFVPSNPWVAVGWRDREEIEVNLDDVMKKKRINFITQGAARVHPGENRIELCDGTNVAYDYLVIATGPDLAFDEIRRAGPGWPYPIHLPYRSRREGLRGLRGLRQESRPHRNWRGAGRVLLRAGL